MPVDFRLVEKETHTHNEWRLRLCLYRIPESNISGFEVRLTTPAVGNAEVEITVHFIYLPTKTSFITHDSQLPHRTNTRTDFMTD